MLRHGKSENEAGSIFLSKQRFILARTVMMELIFSHCSLVYSFILCNFVFQPFLFLTLFPILSFFSFLFNPVASLSTLALCFPSGCFFLFCTPWNLAKFFSFSAFSVSPLPVLPHCSEEAEWRNVSIFKKNRNACFYCKGRGFIARKTVGKTEAQSSIYLFGLFSNEFGTIDTNVAPG